VTRPVTEGLEPEARADLQPKAAPITMHAGSGILHLGRAELVGRHSRASGIGSQRKQGVVRGNTLHTSAETLPP